MTVGIGYDIHRLIEDRKLFLGGVEIPYVKGLLGYSDGDVVIHAIADAILGALALGDIGEHFPNTDARFKGISSSIILKEVVTMAAQHRAHVENIDVTIIAEEPKVAPFKAQMVAALAAVTGVAAERINIKATTNEGVGSLGKGDAIAAYAVVSVGKE